jgi:hypothetical protein
MRAARPAIWEIGVSRLSVDRGLSKEDRKLVLHFKSLSLPGFVRVHLENVFPFDTALGVRSDLSPFLCTF